MIGAGQKAALRVVREVSIPRPPEFTPRVLPFRIPPQPTLPAENSAQGLGSAAARFAPRAATVLYEYFLPATLIATVGVMVYVDVDYYINEKLGWAEWIANRWFTALHPPPLFDPKKYSKPDTSFSVVTKASAAAAEEKAPSTPETDEEKLFRLAHHGNLTLANANPTIQKDLKGALMLCNRMIRRAQRTKDKEYECWLLENKAELLGRLGRMREVLVVRKKQTELVRHSHRWETAIRSFCDLGFAYQTLEKWEEGALAFHQAALIAEQHHSPSQVIEALELESHAWERAGQLRKVAEIRRRELQLQGTELKRAKWLLRAKPTDPETTLEEIEALKEKLARFAAHQSAQKK